MLIIGGGIGPTVAAQLHAYLPHRVTGRFSIGVGPQAPMRAQRVAGLIVDFGRLGDEPRWLSPGPSLRRLQYRAQLNRC